MRPENDIKDDLDRTVGEGFDLTPQEQNFLTLLGDLSESDRGYLLRVAEVMVLASRTILE